MKFRVKIGKPQKVARQQSSANSPRLCARAFNLELLELERQLAEDEEWPEFDIWD